MKNPNQMSRTAILVEGALMVALSFALSLIPLFHMPWGGTVTCFSTLPIVVMSLRHNIKWGVSTAAVYGILQTFAGMNSVVAAGSALSMFGCVLLDYVVAYACIGLTGAIARAFIKASGGEPAAEKHPLRSTACIAGAIGITGLMRLACSFFSGLLIWGAYAPAGTPVWVYSLTYNASWCLPDVAIVLVVAALLSRVRALHIAPGLAAPAK